MYTFRYSAFTIGLLVTGISLAGCSSATSRDANPLSPSSSTPPAATEIVIEGRVINVLTDASLGDGTISPSHGPGVTSDAGGGFRLTVASAADILDLRVSVPGFVDRDTAVRASAGPAHVSMIDRAFDLRAFDEMFRTPQLTRWTAAPPLVIEGTALRFAGFDGNEFLATGSPLSESEIAPLVDDMRWGLPQLTGGEYGDFASVERRQTPAGGSAAVLNAGVITVALYEGLTAATGYWGYGRALVRGDGAVVGGSIMIDRDFNRSGSSLRRALRVHELGHALGANHVVSRTSVMNGTIRTEPTAWDRDAGRLAHRRPPGNRAPDVDPSGSGVNRVATPVWRSAIH